MDSVLIGQQILDARGKKSQQEVADEAREWAEKVGAPEITVTRERLAQLEKGTFEDIKVSTLIGICTALDKTPEELGINFNLRQEHREPGGTTLYIPGGIPGFIVSAVKDLLQAAGIGYDVIKEAKEVKKGVLERQRNGRRSASASVAEE